MRKIKITAVNYLNTKPLLYGIFKSELQNSLDLRLDIPSDCARKLKFGEVDLGLIPVVAIPEIPNAKIITDYCIGSVGAVKTVCLFSEVPLPEIERIYLDYHSRTSVELLKILLHFHWKATPELLPALPGFESQIGGTTAALIIGDRTIGLDAMHRFTYDLGEAWHDYTGLPFVFAAWVTTVDLPAEFHEKLNAALRLGVEMIPQLMYILPTPTPGFDLEKYFTHHISYEFDEAKKEGLNRFFSEMKRLKNSESGKLSALLTD